MTDAINYIDAAEAEFYVTGAGLTGLRYKGTDFGRVTVMRLLPFRYDGEYLSVRTQQHSRAGKDKEIGIIRSLENLSPSQREIVENELKRRYFMPVIKKVISVSEEYGHSVWNVETDSGNREFTVNDMGTNLLHLGGNRVMLTDLFGNRFLFEDVTKMGDKTMKIVEIWL